MTEKRYSDPNLPESVIVIPPHGIQIEIHRGIWGIPVFASRKFIPTFLIRDVIINEALRRWNVVFYLAILSVSHNGEFQLDVLFEVWRAAFATTLMLMNFIEYSPRVPSFAKGAWDCQTTHAKRVLISTCRLGQLKHSTACTRRTKAKGYAT
jgi:hypothetical protein